MDKVYYIKGSRENPEGVKQALLDVCPDAKNPNCLAFTNESGVYYVIDKFIHFSDYSYSATEVIKRVGIELQPKKQEKFAEKIMYQRLFKHQEDIYEAGKYYSTIEEAMSGDEAIGYKEVKIMIKE